MNKVWRPRFESEVLEQPQQRELNEKLNQACFQGRLEDARSALKSGADPEWRGMNPTDYTALMWVARGCQMPVVKFLVEEAKADVNARDLNGQTALMYAVYNSSGDIAPVRYLVEETPAQVNDTDGFGSTALMNAAHAGHIGIVKYLIEKAAAQVNTSDKANSTPVIEAAREGHTAVIQYLLVEASGQVNAARGDHLWTACHWAATNGHLEAVKLLVAHGANIQLRDKDGRTPLELAKHNGHHESVIDYLATLR